MMYTLRTLIPVPDGAPFWHHLDRGKAAKNASDAATFIHSFLISATTPTGFRSSIVHVMSSIDTGAAASQGG